MKISLVSWRRAARKSNASAANKSPFISPSNALRIYAGVLSFICAETLTGASLYWVINPIAYLLAFPIYLTHLLFFYSLAHHCGRRSLQDLYLFGMLFALYESWVTKVLWAGYPGEDGFILGTFLGHGIHEFIVLVPYFHTVVAFLFPLAMTAALFPQTADEIGLKGTFWSKSLSYKILFWFTFTALAFGPPQQFQSIFHALLHWGPTLLLAYWGFKSTERLIKAHPGTPPKLELSKKGTVITGIIIALTYILTYFLLLPERIPSAGVQMVTIAIYLMIIAMIYKRQRPERTGEHDTPPTPRRAFLWLVLMSVATTIIFLLRLVMPEVIFGTAAIGFLLLMVTGICLFWGWAIKDYVPRSFFLRFQRAK